MAVWRYALILGLVFASGSLYAAGMRWPAFQVAAAWFMLAIFLAFIVLMWRETGI